MKNVFFTDKKRFLLNSKYEHSEFVWTNDSSALATFQEISKYNKSAIKVWGIIYYRVIDFVFIERPIASGQKRSLRLKTIKKRY